MAKGDDEETSGFSHFMQLSSVAAWKMTVMWGNLLSWPLFAYLAVSGGAITRALLVLYLAHWYQDRKTPENGKRMLGVKAIRGSKVFKNMEKYFSLDLVKTAELPADRNYLVAAFSHGIINYSMNLTFSPHYSKFRELFPGLRPSNCTLHGAFQFPFTRELWLSWGMISVSAKSIVRALTQSNEASTACNSDGFTSNAIVIMAGGTREMYYARPGDYRLFLQNRKGFVKLAMKTGSSLVPVYSFGEINTHDQPTYETGSKRRAFYEAFEKWTGIPPLLLFGSGITKNSFGILPNRCKLTTVVGAPIAVAKNENPTSQEIDEVHKTFVDALIKLFDDHKKNYIDDWENAKLNIVAA